MTKFIVAFSRMYEVVLAFLLLKLVSDLLTPGEFAKLNLFTAVTQGIALFFISPLQNWILVNNIKATKENWLSSLLIFEILYTIAISIFAFLIMIFFKESFVSSNLLFISIFILSVLTPILLQTLVPIFNIHHLTKVYVSLSILGSTLGFVLPVLLVFSINRQYEIWLLGVYIAQLIVCIYSFKKLTSERIFNSKICSWKIDGLPYKQILKFSIPLSIAVGFQWFNSQGFRLQLENTISLTALGAFIMGFGFGGKFLNAIEKVFSTVLMPGLYNRPDSTSVKKAWLTYFWKMTIIYFVSTSILYVFATHIYGLIISEQYHSGIDFIAAGMLFDMFRCILNSVYQYNMITSRNGLQFVINAIVTMFISGVIYFVFANGVSFNIFVYSMPVIMAVVTAMCFIINYMDASKIENS